MGKRKGPKETGAGGLLFQIRRHLGTKPDLVLFRNQSGAVDRGASGFETYGLTKGASDLIGCLGPNGRWFAIEVKVSEAETRSNSPRVVRQRLFIDLINSFGGYARFVWTVFDAELAYREAGGQYPGDPA